MLKAVLVAGLLTTAAIAAGAEPVKSGPQPGEKMPGPFKPLNATGPDAGKEECLYCKNGPKPVVMVFVREFTPAVVELVKKLDAASALHGDDRLATCVIVLSDAKDLAAGLARWANTEKVTRTVLATYAPRGPEKYHLAPGAAVTVVLYSKHTVKANRSYRAGEFSADGVADVLADLPKILPRD